LKALRALLLKRFTRRDRSHEDTEDLIQEACLRLLEYQGKGHVVVSEEAFLTATVKNLATDQYRTAQRHPYVQETNEELEQNMHIGDSGPTPDEVLEGQQRLEIIRKALDERSVRMRKVFFARHAGYSYKAIATTFAISESTVEKDIARAFLTIRDMRDKE
jgi:RNA polymerase sigma factor (sigma-70 family)